MFDAPVMKIRIIWLALFLSLGISATAYAKSAAGLVNMHLDLSHHQQDQEVRLWLPYPVSSPDQDIEAVQVKGDFAESAVYADKVFRTPILYARWPAGAKSRRLDFSFKATRQEVARRNLPTKETAWDPADYREWLAPTALGPIDDEVKKLADSITKGKTMVLTKARAIYDWTCENMYRAPKTIGCGKGDVCALLTKPGGKCTDIHSVFVALCRAAGVPAREIFGIRLGNAAATDITSWQHCWAEFFLPGYGWVPVDPADVRKAMLVKNLPLDHPEVKKLRDYYWGGWDAERFELAVGRDLILTPAQKGGPLNTFGYPYAEVGGRALDFYDPASFKYSITAIKVEKEGHGLIDTEGMPGWEEKGLPIYAGPDYEKKVER